VFQYAKGIAASVVVASLLWFGGSKINLSDKSSGPTQWIANNLKSRAAFESEDNFHTGLASWNASKSVAKSWNFDKEGFIRPTQLALYKPSKDMTDYRLEFLTQIERKGVGWVFRAADEQNYYAMKLAVVQQSPRLMVSVVRYAVIDGRKGVATNTPVAMMMHPNRPYRVSVDVKGNQFSTAVEGQTVDTWSDDRLRAGAVGFFTESGERARLYWMRVSKNTDFLGRLCAFLAPSGAPGVLVMFSMPPVFGQEQE
jgi:hypothetical protein